MAKGEHFPFNSNNLEIINRLATLPRHKREIVLQYWNAWVRVELLYQEINSQQTAEFQSAVSLETEYRQILDGMGLEEFTR